MKNRRRNPTLIRTASLPLLICVLLGVFAFRTYDSRASGDRSGTIESGGRTRNYFVHIPPAYNGQKMLPVVFVLHGGGQSPESAERMSGMSIEADRGNFLAVYPAGTGFFSHMPTWNSGNCCAYALRNRVDDIGFFRVLIDQLEREYTVDPKRIYVTGISNGGMMAYRLGCELADTIAAIAPVEGAQNTECRPAVPVSLIVFHGTADRLVPFNGGSTRFQIGPARKDNSVSNAVSFWVNEDGCSPRPHYEETRSAHLTAYSDCKDNTGVALYAMEGGRHAWPDTWISGNQLPATELIWSFFAQHPKP